MSKAEWNEYIGQISYMFQSNALFDSLTVFENVAMPLKYTTKLKKKEIEKKAMARIEQTELTDVFDKYPSELSGGMQKRTALARALVTDPGIVLFDEPTTGQDPIRKNAILSMVAEYQKRFGFTALMISHEIPDVYFISNRILALYDRKIVFQGDPEEFESLDHPFRQELISSLESLGEELTGLYSKRHFKVRYQTDLSQRNPDATYAAAVFTLDNIDAISEHMGHDATQQIIRSLGSYINKHFGAVGGFSSRQTINEYATVLPYSDIDEAQRILEDFTKDFQEHGIKGIEVQRGEKGAEENCVEFSVLAGLAQGKPQIEIESVMEFARFNQKEISRFKCESGGTVQ
jgi:phospholipid/cholesterol/gamma-HCH transport system ATP-binding protein